MAITLYNTLTRKKEAFKPLEAGKVGMYSCGPTVYSDVHIGNLRAFVFADTLKRILTYNGLEVTHVMNITDVGHLSSDADEGEDKMEKGAKRDGISVWDIAKKYTDTFMQDIAALNIIEPGKWCRATDHILEQIEQIKLLEEKGVTYKTEDGIYFDTSKLEDYGKLALLKVDDLQEGSRVDMGEKKHKTDFALWKFSPKDAKRAMEWESPWGMGFPGWHIECSAMSTKYLGEHFDIHTGGMDLIPVHHTNEIAQSECAWGHKPWVNYWMHNEFLVNDKGKMAKSSGEFLILQTLLDKGYEALDYRYFLMTGNYRQQLQFSWEAMDSAKQSRERLMNVIEELREEETSNGDVTLFETEFLDAVNDDLNTSKALATLWNALRDKELGTKEKLALAAKFDEVLGLKLLDKEELSIPKAVIALAEQRIEARKAKDFAESDKLRDEINAKGFLIDDQKEGYKIRKK